MMNESKPSPRDDGSDVLHEEWADTMAAIRQAEREAAMGLEYLEWLWSAEEGVCAHEWVPSYDGDGGPTCWTCEKCGASFQDLRAD